MLERMKQLLAPPVFADEDKSRVAGLLKTMLLILVGLTLFYGLQTPFSHPERPTPLLLSSAGLLLLWLSALWLIHRGWLRAVSLLLPAVLWLMITLIVINAGGIRSSSVINYLTVIVVSGVILRDRAGIIFATLTMLTILGLVYAESNQLLPPASLTSTLWSTWSVLTGNLAVVAVFLYMSNRSLTGAINRGRRNEAALADSNQKLREQAAARQQAEETLEGEHTLLRTVIDNLPDYIYLKNTQYQCLVSNLANARALGAAAAEDVAGKSLFDFYPPEEAEQYNSLDRLVIETGQPVNREISFEDLTTDQHRWAWHTRIPFRAPDGTILGVVGISRDITERKLAEEALRRSEERYRNFIEQSTEGIWMLAFDEPIPLDLPPEEQVRRIQTLGYVAECNDVLARMYGYASSQELRGVRLLELYGDYREVNFQATLKLVRAGYRSSNRETQEVTASGETVYFLNHAVGIIQQGQLVALWGTQQDITALKQAEQALRESEHKFRSLIEQAYDAIILSDYKGKVIEWNRAAEQFTGYVQAEMLGCLFWEVQFRLIPVEKRSPAVLEQLAAMGRQGLQTGAAPWLNQPLEGELQRADGTRRYFQQVAFPIQSAKGFMIGTFIRDITGRKQAEAEREKLIAEMEAKNAELERFTYTVSHDLKSPLVTINGFLGWLEKDIQAGKIDRLKADINRIREATNKMYVLLEELLELSRIGRLVNPPAEAPFETIVREALALVEGRLASRGIVVKVADNLPIVSGDQTRLVEVVQNLVDNAAKFMGNQLRPRIEIGVREQEGEQIFFVRDNGIGIAPQYREKIFGLFDKLEPHSEGTGIGLAIVKRIIEVHGGRIWVESDGPGQGATFYFILPPAASSTA